MVRFLAHIIFAPAIKVKPIIHLEIIKFINSIQLKNFKNQIYFLSIRQIKYKLNSVQLFVDPFDPIEIIFYHRDKRWFHRAIRRPKTITTIFKSILLRFMVGLSYLGLQQIE